MSGALLDTDALAVALTARQRGLRVITSDPDDIRRLDSHLDVVPI